MNDTTGASVHEQRARIEQLISDHDIETVMIGAVDVDGMWRGKGVAVEYFLDKVLEEGTHICKIMFAWDIADDLLPDVEFAGWHNGYPDFVIKPDLETFTVLPWEHRTAAVICDLYEFDGTPVALSPRQVLKDVLARAEKHNLAPMIGYELEFLLLAETSATIREKGFRDLVPMQAGSSTYSLVRLALHDEVLGELRREMQKCGIRLEGATTEWGESQFEINLRYTTALKAADQATIYKLGVKSMAARRGLTASFMAKYDEKVGNSGHIHQSLADTDGRNVMFDPDADDKLSVTARRYIAGLVASMRELTLFFCPNVNSYKRKVAESFTSTTATWGIDNRTTGLRVLPMSESAARIEHRLSGGDANPYLAIAASVAGGFHGIENELDPGPPVVGNAYALDPDEVETLPSTLDEAVDATDASTLARDLFGAAFVDHYIQSRRWELNVAQSVVTDWERARYLENV